MARPANPNGRRIYRRTSDGRYCVAVLLPDEHGEDAHRRDRGGGGREARGPAEAPRRGRAGAQRRAGLRGRLPRDLAGGGRPAQDAPQDVRQLRPLHPAAPHPGAGPGSAHQARAPARPGAPGRSGPDAHPAGVDRRLVPGAGRRGLPRPGTPRRWRLALPADGPAHLGGATAGAEHRRAVGPRPPNVATRVDPPPVPEHEADHLTPAEATRLLAVLEGDRLEALYVLALTLGLRQGEVLGLCWDDLDLDAGLLHVQQALQRLWAKDGPRGRGRCPPRRRRAGAPSRSRLQMVAAPRRRRRRQRGARRRLGRAGSRAARTRPSAAWSSPPAWAPRSSRPTSPATSTATWSGPASPGAASTTCATRPDSILLAMGVPPRTVMEILGHSTATMTMVRYGHVALDQQRAAWSPGWTPFPPSEDRPAGQAGADAVDGKDKEDAPAGAHAPGVHARPTAS